MAVSDVPNESEKYISEIKTRNIEANQPEKPSLAVLKNFNSKKLLNFRIKKETLVILYTLNDLAALF